MIMHYKDIFTNDSDCGMSGKRTLSLDKVNCLKCLEITKKEWKRQVKTFLGQPLKNATEGLKEVNKRIKELKYANARRGEKDEN